MAPPSDDCSIKQLAEWLTREPLIVDTLKKRLEEDNIRNYAELDGAYIFLTDCDKCTVPLILHMKKDECEDLVGVLVGNYKIPMEKIVESEDLENLRELFDTEIRKLSWFAGALEILKEMHTRTCICKRLCQSKQGLLTHKRSCQTAKDRASLPPQISRLIAASSDTSENGMIMRLINQMARDNKELIQGIQNDNKENRKLQQEQNKIF